MCKAQGSIPLLQNKQKVSTYTGTFNKHLSIHLLAICLTCLIKLRFLFFTFNVARTCTPPSPYLCRVLVSSLGWPGMHDLLPQPHK